MDHQRGRRRMEVRFACSRPSWRTTPTAKPPLDGGQGLAEYALILTLIAIVAILALIFLGSDIQRMLSQVGTSV